MLAMLHHHLEPLLHTKSSDAKNCGVHEGKCLPHQLFAGRAQVLGSGANQTPATSSTRENLHRIQNQAIVNLFFMVHSVLFSPNPKISNGTDSSSLQISFMMLLPFIRQDKRVQINKG